MIENLCWTAPVEPGRGMLGLTLGQSLSDVRSALDQDAHLLVLPDAPKILVEVGEDDVMTLRAADLHDCPYDWQNILATLVFREGVLTFIRVERLLGEEALGYKGKLFGEIGLGSRVSELQRFGTLGYDDAEEVFFSDQWPGIEMGGEGACDLAGNPEQGVTSFTVFQPRQAKQPAMPASNAGGFAA